MNNSNTLIGKNKNSNLVPFVARTIQSVDDLSKDEQIFLYTSALKIKHAFLHKDYDYLSSIMINDNNFAAYLLFQENSTRTKESFYSAAQFHKMRAKEIVLSQSSVEKNETFTDTIKTLLGYAEQSCFIIRSSIEGVCRWLESVLAEYVEKHGMAPAFCINAGDGRNEHPSQEFLDEFSFYEYYKEDVSHIHIALIGDLLHGRTVHSKCQGLQIFKSVAVDLIAPEEIAMPDHYVRELKDAGYQVRIFESLEEYTSQNNRAKLWYFTRLQRERLSEMLHPHIKRLQNNITLTPEIQEKNIFSDDMKLFHPLPRDKYHPSIPYTLDSSVYNAWETQSMNGYYVRIALLAMLSGRIGQDFKGAALSKNKTHDEPFIIPAQLGVKERRHTHEKPSHKIGIKPVEKGIVIDHIAKGMPHRKIWNKIDRIRRVLNLNVVSSHGVYSSYDTKYYKGIISIPDYEISTIPAFKKLGAITPGCTLNIINDAQVIEKLRIQLPPKIYNFSECSCRNPRCVSHHSQIEQAYARFYRYNDEYVCHYCTTPHTIEEIWKIDN